MAREEVGAHEAQSRLRRRALRLHEREVDELVGSFIKTLFLMKKQFLNDFKFLFLYKSIKIIFKLYFFRMLYKNKYFE
jgi:hypothetical protein